MYDKEAYAKYNIMPDISYKIIEHLMTNPDAELIWKLLKYNDADAYLKPDLTMEEKRYRLDSLIDEFSIERIRKQKKGTGGYIVVDNGNNKLMSGELFEVNGDVLKVHKAKCGRKGDFGPAGTVVSADKHGLEVTCNGGTVLFMNIQAPGKKAMDVSAYFLGNKIEIGTVLG